jgi:mono/diheme cytochrome c family protein
MRTGRHLTLKAAGIFVLAGSLCLAAELPPPAQRAMDFARDVRPLFQERCIGCHGPEKQKSGYHLDSRDAALKGGDSGDAAIIPGKSADSPLIQFVAGLDADKLMPPKKSDKPRLTPDEIGVLRAWIDQGAVWPEDASLAKRDPLDWWSLKPIVKSAVPEIRNPQSAIRNPIDAFIRAKLAEKNLTPSSEADPRTLCRRLYFDLIGLPPTPEELEAFLQSAIRNPQSAFESLVDKLLASPRHGERWARHWLDIVHYGDTHGYDKDKQRPNAWPYRDYVIRAFNEDKPYACFVQEQIAGDALFPGTRDGIEALGFIAAGPWDFIGHAEVPETKTDGKIARHLDRDDMVANTIGTFCSATIHCAQCHNHKFDPIPQEDYYSLQAVFAALDRTDRKYYRDDTVNARFAELTRHQRDADAALATVEEPLRKKAGEQFNALTRRIEGASKAAAQKLGNTSPDFGYHSAISPKQDAVKWVQVDLGQHVDIQSVALLPCYDDFNAIGAGFGFPVRFKVEASDDPDFKTGVALLWRHHDATFMADFKNPGLTPFTTGGAKDDGIAGRYVRVTATKLAPRKDDFILALAELQIFDATGKNVAQGKAVTALDSIEAPPRWRKANLTDGIAPVVQTPDEKEKLVQEREALLLSFADDATKARRSAALAESQRIAAELKKLPPPAVVFAGGVHTGGGNFMGTGANGGKPRPIFLLARGQVTHPGKEMAAGTLSALSFAPASFSVAPDAPEGERRAALAQWITNPRNPLTWRSIVNRVWQYHFGRGLVETSNDFGRNGGRPSHPELLDWLAADFRDSGGSLKRLHKLIVMSATYRQSSVAADGRRQAIPETGEQKPETGKDEATRENQSAIRNPQSAIESARLLPSAATIDANNALLWRQNRRKLEAEAVRDSVLAVSGKLDLTAGGPGWQDFVIEHPEHSPHYEYNLANPEDPKSWRRSIYRFIVRSQTQPWMTSLDCADPSMRVDKRNESLSALQALALLNNGFMLTQSRHFAERVQRDAPDLSAQIEHAHQLAFGRTPTPDERERLIAFAKTNGLPNLCRVLLNLNEFTFVD